MKTIKQFSLLILVLFSFGRPAYALMRLGIQGGVNLANLSSDLQSSYEQRTGLTLGALVEFGLGEWLTLQPELLYTQKGANLGFITTKLDYLDIPVFLKLVFPLPLIKPFIFAGPRLSLKASANSDVSGISSTPITSAKSTVFGLDFGAGGELGISPVTSFFVSLKYSMDFDSAFEAANSGKNKSFAILGGFIFGL